MRKIIRWILTPLAFPAGLILGHFLGLINVLIPLTPITLIFTWLICGACSSIGSIMLPTWVAPSKKHIIKNIAFWCQVILFIASVGLTIYQSSLVGKELFKYIVSMIGALGGIIYCRFSLNDFVSERC